MGQLIITDLTFLEREFPSKSEVKGGVRRVSRPSIPTPSIAHSVNHTIGHNINHQISGGGYTATGIAAGAAAGAAAATTNGTTFVTTTTGVSVN